MLISLQYDKLLAKGKILCGQICDDIELPGEPIAEHLDEKQHYQTLIPKCLKRNGVNAYEYLRATGDFRQKKFV
jgi:hypothetical protein